MFDSVWEVLACSFEFSNENLVKYIPAHGLFDAAELDGEEADNLMDMWGATEPVVDFFTPNDPKMVNTDDHHPEPQVDNSGTRDPEPVVMEVGAHGAQSRNVSANQCVAEPELVDVDAHKSMPEPITIDENDDDDEYVDEGDDAEGADEVASEIQEIDFNKEGT